MSGANDRVPFFRVDYEERVGMESRENALACEMGRPPWRHGFVGSSQTARDLADRQVGAWVGFIFDPCFYYSPDCWDQWLDAVLDQGDVRHVYVPLGNQDPLWRIGLDIPLYLTLRGLEIASQFAGPDLWMERTPSKSTMFPVAIVPVSLLSKNPDVLEVGSLPEYWRNMGQAMHIFCRGWLHAFNGLEDAGCRRDLLDMCDWRGRVLELGCDRGLMAGTCRESGFDGAWIGIDQNGDGLRQARGSMDLAVQADICKPLPLSSGSLFDRIVCADVLEHLPYPWDVLRDLRQRIQPDGLLVASVPNVGHWSVVEDLMAGRWDETPSGLLCVTHLRFGTKRSWERWFKKSGWRVMKWERETLPPPDNWQYLTAEKRQAVDRQSLETIRYRLIAIPS